ncbi:DinB family protein [Paenibacillus sp. N4]|uniref:DinB family protein n=1 Tax=Paenibacillus vietnamensis TaxID=2590547 RepID=UPI001CD0E902|nr:DinB family protein [Paenibacillus vietnamensis]MCA0754175.1 DinB family protein [Paenibacillus vietnamensis]
MTTDLSPAALFRRNFEHAYWANLQAIKSLRQPQGSLEKPLKLLSHLVAAEAIWLSRLNGDDEAPITVWPELTLDQCAELADQNKRGYEKWFDEAGDGDFSKMLTYRTSTGIEFHTAVSDILMHAVLHGSYHRGQIASLVKSGGGQPEITDFIQFVRHLG